MKSLFNARFRNYRVEIFARFPRTRPGGRNFPYHAANTMRRAAVLAQQLLLSVFVFFLTVFFPGIFFTFDAAPPPAAGRRATNNRVIRAGRPRTALFALIFFPPVVISSVPLPPGGDGSTVFRFPFRRAH